MSISLNDVALDEADSLLLTLPSFPCLNQDQIKRPIEYTKDRHPMETSFTLPLSSAPHWSMMAGIYKRPSKQAIKKYQEEAYPQWLLEVEHFLDTFPAILQARSRSKPLAFALRSDGIRPAENVLLTIKTSGNIFLSPPEKDDEEIKCPPPPEAPKVTRTDIFRNLGTFQLMQSGPLSLPNFARPSRDPNKFY